MGVVWWTWLWRLGTASSPEGGCFRFDPPGHWVVDGLPAVCAILGLLAARRWRLNRAGHGGALLAVLGSALLGTVLLMPRIEHCGCGVGAERLQGADLRGLATITAAAVLAIGLRAALYTHAGDTPRRAWWALLALSLLLAPLGWMVWMKLTNMLILW